MKKFTPLFLVAVLVIASCTVTIPMQSNLSEQTLLLAENRDIKVNYSLESEVPDGYIRYTFVQRNGTESRRDQGFRYSSATAFSKIWESYFANKFNSYATNVMDVKVVMKKLELREQASTSAGATILTGVSRVNVQAEAELHVMVTYQGETYEKDIKVNVSDYNESQSSTVNGVVFTSATSNPTQQKSKLLESCLNRSVIQFENFLKSVIRDQG